MVTDSWYTFSNGGAVRYCCTFPPSLHQSPNRTTERQTDHRLFYKKHIDARISKTFWPPTPHWEAICVNPRYWVSISCCVHRGYPAKRALSAMLSMAGRALLAGYPWHVSAMSFRWNAILGHIILIVFDAIQIVELSPDEGEPSPALCLHVTNDSCSLKRHNKDKKTFDCYI